MKLTLATLSLVAFCSGFNNDDSEKTRGQDQVSKLKINNNNKKKKRY